MAQETIESIRKAEAEAEQIEKNAASQAEEIVAKAHEEAEELVKSLTREARMNADAALNAANAKGGEMMADAEKEADREVGQLKESISSKEAEAVRLIVSELI